jgi:hypothetical protein
MNRLFRTTQSPKKRGQPPDQPTVYWPVQNLHMELTDCRFPSFKRLARICTSNIQMSKRLEPAWISVTIWPCLNHWQYRKKRPSLRRNQIKLCFRLVKAHTNNYISLTREKQSVSCLCWTVTEYSSRFLMCTSAGDSAASECSWRALKHIVQF